MKEILVEMKFKTGDKYVHPTLGAGTLVLVGECRIHSGAGTPMFAAAIFEPETLDKSAEAVVIKNHLAELTVTVVTLRNNENINSDSNTFTEVVGGCRDNFSKDQAIQAVLGFAQDWANSLRNDNPELEFSIFDSAGNCY